MFGNKLGWGISAALAAAVLSLVAYLGRLNQISPPSRGQVTRTGNVTLNLPDNPALLEPIQFPFAPTSVYPGMTEAKDAAPLYREAIEQYEANRAAYDDLFRSGAPRTKDYRTLPAFEALVQARTANAARLFESNPSEVIDYKAYPPPLDALNRVGKAAGKLALYLAEERKEDALALAEAVFSLGVKLADERLRWFEFQTGVELMRDGANVIARLDPSRAAAARQAEEHLKRLMKERWMPLWIVISSIDPAVIGRTGGDIFYIARNSKERMWRIEAALKLGRYKYDHGNPGHAPNQRWALIVARRMAADQSLDPAVRVAAEAARDLTFERYNLIGGF